MPSMKATAASYWLFFARLSGGGRLPLPSWETGAVTEEEFSLLRELVEKSNDDPRPIIEIGTLIGRTTTRIASFANPNRPIFTVDFYCWNPWGFTNEAHYRLAAHSLRFLTDSGRVELIRMDKDKFYETYSGTAPSLVFLDAIHDYKHTKADIVWAKRIGAGIISGHDYSPQFPGVVQAVDEFGGPKQLCGTVWTL